MEPHVLEVLCDLQLRFHDGRLLIHSSKAGDPQLGETPAGLLLRLWKVLQYTSSRW